ncbi:palmdelphin isoform X2 [Trichomycterus rosablanca]|uniref:palmdelphin isoform X2 n=1 Tax=Trichomycterus rosablanca TaxID=2290929 RepID=UPI002F35FF8C
MEETTLIKERLQAITNKRKIQQNISSKRLEIDREKLKLQHLKKRSMRDLWLMSGSSPGEEQSFQNDAQQTKILQSNIHRMEKEIEALEREELNISRNEEFILTRLKAVERSTEDIIKAANENFKSEPVQVHPGTSDPVKSYTPLNIRKTLTVGHKPQNDQNKPALYAMEINVQKDLRTGESRVLSTCTVSAQELQQRGVKVYDDGRKSVYAVRSAPGQPQSSEPDELSPGEVEDLLKQATMRKQKHQEQNEPPRFLNHERNLWSGSYSAASEWPELEYIDSDGHRPEQDVHQPAHEVHSYRPDQEYYHMDSEVYEGKMRRGPGAASSHKGSPGQMNPRPASSLITEPRPRALHAVPSDQPVTMIFMGYQQAEDDARSFEGSVQAELIVIEDGEEDHPYQKAHFHPQRNHNTNNATTYPTMEKSATVSQTDQTV